MQALTSGDGNLVHGAMRVLTGTIFVTFVGSTMTNKLFISNLTHFIFTMLPVANGQAIHLTQV